MRIGPRGRGSAICTTKKPFGRVGVLVQVEVGAFGEAVEDGDVPPVTRQFTARISSL